KDIMAGIKSARNLLNELGIYLVWCEPIRNCKVRGALTTYKRNPAILISGRFKSHDHIWFAIMHEIGHLLYHYGSQEMFISMDKLNQSNEKETEANRFARHFFIEEKDFSQFVNSE